MREPWRVFTSLPLGTPTQKLVDEEASAHICEICGKSFISYGNCNRHIQTVHEGERNHRCDICSKPTFES